MPSDEECDTLRVFVEVLIYKGTRLLQLKNYKRSIKYFDQVLTAIILVSKREAIEMRESRSIFCLHSTPALSEEFVTKQSRVLNNKAVALMNLRKHEEAIECLKEVLKMKPDHVKAMNNLGDNLNSLQKFEEAIEMFDKALRLDPHRLSVLYNKGNSYLHMKRYPFIFVHQLFCLELLHIMKPSSGMTKQSWWHPKT